MMISKGVSTETLLTDALGKLTFANIKNLEEQWLPRVDDFIAGLCENEREMVPLALREKIEYALKRLHRAPEKWPAVYLLSEDGGNRVLVAPTAHSHIGRPSKV